MKKMFLSAFILLISAICDARVKLPDLISNNMVLQQESEVALWGKCEPKSKVKVTVSWDGSTTSTMADAEGNWKVYVKTPSAGGPYSINFNDGEDTVVENVLIGEVWLCLGQSNMAMTMRGYKSQPVEDAMKYIADAKPSCPIRICKIKRSTGFTEAETCEASWRTHTPEVVSQASATAYFFALKLQETLNVPIGVIVSAWGGSKIEAWMSRETLEAGFASDVDLSFIDAGQQPEKPQHAPTMLYNGMLGPVKNYQIKGFTWYQGCSNRNNPELYSRLQPEFVKMLRKLWSNDELPFYYVQIAPYEYKGRDKIDAALLREAQAENSKTIPHSGMVVSMDCGDDGCIHPAKKKPIGDRLAYLALQKTYGMSCIDAEPPMYESHEIKGDAVHVKFTETLYGGVGPRGRNLVGFEVAGEDRKFYPAEARCDKDNHVVVVKSDSVSAPVAVRYGFRNCSPVSVYNNFGIPASPFRTDNWK